MTSNPRPTRAEATDVANLVLDGADCIMLGAETFGGDYPVGSVKIVSRIARRAEMSFDSGEYYQSLVDDSVGEAGEWTGSKVLKSLMMYYSCRIMVVFRSGNYFCCCYMLYKIDLQLGMLCDLVVRIRIVSMPLMNTDRSSCIFCCPSSCQTECSIDHCLHNHREHSQNNFKVSTANASPDSKTPHLQDYC